MVAITIANTLGAMQIGSTLAVFLFGIVTLQLDTYIQLFADDKWVLKLTVAAVWCLELAHTICVAAEAYRGTITFYGRIAAYQRYPLMGAATLLGGLITFVVQCFFCLRVWKALPNPFRYIGAACGAAAFVRAIGSVYLGGRVIIAKTLAEYREANRWLIRALLVSGTSIDVIIAASMLYFLLKKRNSGFSTTTRLVDRLVAYTVRTGLLTSITAILVLVTFEIFPETFIWVGIYVFLAKLYSNSLLSALNERRRLRIIVSENSTEKDSRAARHKISTGGRSGIHSNPAISIEMKTTVTCDDDQEKGAPLYSHSHTRSGDRLVQLGSHHMGR